MSRKHRLSCTQVGKFEGQVASYMKFGQHHKNLEKTNGFLIVLMGSGPQDGPTWHQHGIQNRSTPLKHRLNAA